MASGVSTAFGLYFITMEKKLTDRQIRGRVDTKTKEFMASVRAFLATKAGNSDGSVPKEWECSIMLLEAYFRQFLELDMRIQELDSVVVEGRYGPMVSPLCAARDKASCRLESQMKELGISMKSAIKLNVVDAKKEESVLDKYMKGKIEKR